LKRTALTSAARPVKAPASVKTPSFTNFVSTPASRAAFTSEPVA
jgi:hypothetical protein